MMDIGDFSRRVADDLFDAYNEGYALGFKDGRTDEITLTLNSPITEEQWDAIADVDFDHTDSITFYTKHGKTVKFIKDKSAEWRTYGAVTYCSNCEKVNQFKTAYCPHCWIRKRTKMKTKKVTGNDDVSLCQISL